MSLVTTMFLHCSVVDEAVVRELNRRLGEVTQQRCAEDDVPEAFYRFQPISVDAIAAPKRAEKNLYGCVLNYDTDVRDDAIRLFKEGRWQIPEEAVLLVSGGGVESTLIVLAHAAAVPSPWTTAMVETPAPK